ncbi:hypothetical protein BT96DRAFT_996635 [Gymnopus androsaceus JB14]|uniref:Uncharacterized protein n=1 Tax=Gymnopus androsaceus JB14 TaxID=1447944 RepID=A0A6A4HFA1_9AGAR|nr:hypothetical protein BT96DRAFT_996635 [Gymnopus androsaceus JB14]
MIRAALEVVVEDFLKRVSRSGYNLRITAILTTNPNFLDTPLALGVAAPKPCHKTQEICCQSVTPGDFEEAYQIFLRQLPQSDNDLTITAIMTTV